MAQSEEASPPSRRRLARREIAAVLGIALAGTALRFALALCSRGTNDIVTWEGFADQAEEHGVTWMYENVPGWNHPPLMGDMLIVLKSLADFLHQEFAPTFKLVPIFADLASAFLVFGAWFRRTGDFASALRALAIFSFSLNALLVSAYHGNTDPLVGALLLAACSAAAKERFALAGVLAGASVNVKLIPVLLFPLLIARANPRQALRFCAGATLGAAPFLPVLYLAGGGFVKNALLYRSNFDNWGIPLVIRTPWYVAKSRGFTALQHALESVRDVYVELGTFVTIGAILWLSFRTRFVKNTPVFECVALGFALFLLLAPGFGVQYTAILGPVLTAASLRWGLCWALLSGVFLLTAYFDFWTGTFPLYSHFYSTLRIPAATVGVGAWALLVAFVWKRLFGVRPASAESA
jgi:hypothetical protein